MYQMSKTTKGGCKCTAVGGGMDDANTGGTKSNTCHQEDMSSTTKYRRARGMYMSKSNSHTTTTMWDSTVNRNTTSKTPCYTSSANGGGYGGSILSGRRRGGSDVQQQLDVSSRGGTRCAYGRRLGVSGKQCTTGGGRSNRNGTTTKKLAGRNGRDCRDDIIARSKRVVEVSSGEKRKLTNVEERNYSDTNMLRLSNSSDTTKKHSGSCFGTAEKKTITPMKENPKKPCFSSNDVNMRDTNSANPKVPITSNQNENEKVLHIRGGVFTREDLLVDISQRLKVMRHKESTHYTCPDYLKDEFQQKLREATEADQAALRAEEAAKKAKEAKANGVIRASEESDARQPSVEGDGASGGSTNNGSSTSTTSSSVTTGTNSTIDELWREKISEWCYQVVDHFDFNREVVSVAMNYLDRYLATRLVNRRIFQLAAMTALYLAIKLFEPGKLRMASLIDLSRGYFMAEHIVTMEDSMLQSLRWYVHPPTSFAFCRDFMRLVSGDISPRARHDVNELARFMTELAVCDYFFITKKPSSIALAALINAIELQGPRRVDPRYKVEFLHRVVELGMDIASDDEIIECYERLREMYIAGGYTPNLEDAPPAAKGDGRIATISPAGHADGPDEDDLDDGDISMWECV